ncbi:hypothetical protein RWV98_17520 [Agathobaculum sp. NTUH-O15-33]|uniref:hypothetical protein n=1 Tax=Agathobaculum sp. NTUH-O15-33 TaxID=3079302 RepID=UPI00295878A1|nr:hypothetical protein [Agathobaculum sp. NTUH-O15-33]WNX84351.1 hypothetical protein RWV98_17520 [Agathobaculum sp. NTUH-O15-33]
MDNRIQQIKERLRATTPGAWKVWFSDTERFSPTMPDEDPCITTESGDYIAQTTYDGLSDTCRPTMYADAEFIAHAKEDIEYLINQITNLEIALDANIY